MTLSHNAKRLLALLGATIGALTFGYAQAQDKPVAIQGAQCVDPPYLKCPDTGCTGATVINQGPVVEMKTRRPYFLDYPCDLKSGEQVIFILSLHGGGSYGNWQRNYFPIMDFKNKYRLVIATPNAPTRQWDMAGADDEYLKNIVDFVLAELAKNNVQVKSFWLAGHSWGGLTSNRLLRTDYFAGKVDGFLSLSGGRLGGQPVGGGFGPRTGAAANAQRPAAPPGGSTTASLMTSLPMADFSFIFTTGRREMGEQGFPAESDWAKKYGCGAKVRRDDIVDTKGGYVFDSSRLNTMNPAWGLVPGPGTAEVYEYPNCKDGRVVFDVARMNKGHTEGLEPNVTEHLVKLMTSAKGGKLLTAK